VSDSSSTAPEVAATPIDAETVDRVAEDEKVGVESPADVLAVLDAELLGMHSEFEREYEYVTVEDRRAYVVDAEAWASLVDGHDLDPDLARRNVPTPNRHGSWSTRPSQTGRSARTTWGSASKPAPRETSTETGTNAEAVPASSGGLRAVWCHPANG
jgi:hypothetical protein